MRDRLLSWELEQFSLQQLAEFIQRGKFVDEARAEWKRRTKGDYPFFGEGHKEEAV